MVSEVTYLVYKVNFQMLSGDRQWNIRGFYVAPDNALTIEDIVAAIGIRPWGVALLVVFNFNTNLAAPKVKEQDKVIASALAG